MTGPWVYSIFILVGAMVVSHMGNMWIGPWAIFPPYVDGALLSYILILHTERQHNLFINAKPDRPRGSFLVSTSK